ncbi:uncharacterized protein LOC133729849 isoform X2 [Rosa rugosa]|nr:uncharacterized protein LOC133729849 isoform X2 [Rosa rugosa]
MIPRSGRFIHGMPCISIYDTKGFDQDCRLELEEDSSISRSSSVGNNSDESNGSSEGEVQSSFKGPLDTMDQLEEVLPVKGDEPTGHKEIFNHAHSSLRGVIERTFGVWKKKRSILRDMPFFPYEKQVKIVIATMALHNYIRRYAQQDIDFDESGNYSSEEMEDNEHDGDGPGRQEIEVLRNAIAQSLMNAST